MKGVKTDLQAQIFMMETAERPLLFVAIWLDGWKNAKMEGWVDSKEEIQRYVL